MRGANPPRTASDFAARLIGFFTGGSFFAAGAVAADATIVGWFTVGRFAAGRFEAGLIVWLTTGATMAVVEANFLPVFTFGPDFQLFMLFLRCFEATLAVLAAALGTAAGVTAALA